METSETCVCMIKNPSSWCDDAHTYVCIRCVLGSGVYIRTVFDKVDQDFAAGALANQNSEMSTEEKKKNKLQMPCMGVCIFDMYQVVLCIFEI